MLSIADGCFWQCASCIRRHGISKFSTTVRKLAKPALKPLNHYQVLGVEKNASQDDIRKAFVAQSKQVHPDRNPDDPLNHEKFVALNEAYAVLSKTVSRRQYDNSLASYLRQREMMARNVYGPQTPGETPAPGTGFHDNTYEDFRDAQQRAYWDQTVWQMREQQTYHTEESNFFMFRMLRRRRTKAEALMFCFSVMVLGFVIFYFKYLFYLRHKNKMIEDTRLGLIALHEARTRGRQLGVEGNIERLRAHFVSKGLIKDDGADS